MFTCTLSTEDTAALTPPALPCVLVPLLSSDIDMQRKKMVAMRDAVRVNQAFCDAIVASHVVGDGFLKPPEHPGSPVDAATGKLRLPVTAPRHFSKVQRGGGWGEGAGGEH